MTEPVTCAACIHYRPDDVNPPMGMGMCALKRLGMFPDAPHYCRQREIPAETAPHD